jgi:hypothetical protein
MEQTLGCLYIQFSCSHVDVKEMFINRTCITLGIKCYLKVPIKTKVKAFALEQQPKKAVFHM